MADLERLLERLVQHEVEFVLIEGYAAMMHGVSLLTAGTLTSARHFSEPISNGFTLQLPISTVSFFSHRSRCHSRSAKGLNAASRAFYIGTDLGRVDFVGEVAGVGGYQALLDSSIAVQLPFGTIRVISRSALIAAKSAMDRPRDRIAVD
jgi:hypothetical protein